MKNESVFPTWQQHKVFASFQDKEEAAQITHAFVERL